MRLTFTMPEHMRSSTLALAAVLLTASASACASSGSSGGNGTPGVGTGAGSASPAVSGSRTRSGSRDVIRADEVSARATDASNAYDIVQKLRPQMLVGRGTASPYDAAGETSQPKVYVDNVSFGDLASLRNIVANQVFEIRFISASDATTRWGTGHMGGVILVTTKRR